MQLDTVREEVESAWQNLSSNHLLMLKSSDDGQSGPSICHAALATGELTFSYISKGSSGT